MISYKELIDRIVGPREENDDGITTPKPNSYSTTDITDNKTFGVEAVEDGPGPDQILLMVGSGNIISGIGGVNYNCIVINHRGKKNKFSPGKVIKVEGIKMGPDKTYISYTADHSRTTLNIFDYYGEVEFISDDTNLPSAFEIIFNAIVNDSNLQQILNESGKEGNDFLSSITGRESDFVNNDGFTINYEKVRQKLGISIQQKSKTISEIRNEVINEITAVLSRPPTLANSDLSSNYRNWQEQIKNLNDETAIKNFRDVILVVIKTKRAERETSQRFDEGLDQANSENATDEQRVETLKNSGDLVGQETSEQKTKIEQIENELTKNPAKLREAVQGLLTKQMVHQKVKAEELTSSKAE
jgi:hypothetical protein